MRARKTGHSYNKVTDSTTCGCLLGLVVLNLTVGAYSFNYCLLTMFGKNVSWVIDLIGGLVLGQFAIPTAIISWILKISGVHTPFFA